MSGAIFGPFGAFESFGGMMAFGGINGMADSLLNQAIEGEFSLGQTLFDGLMGAATAGLLHGAGKLVSKVLPYLKNGIGKVLSKASGEAKNILSKVSGKLDDVMGAFSKTSKELFYKAANKADDVLRSIKNSAQDLADRLSGKFNEITSKIDDKIDDLLHSAVNKADDALNDVNRWVDKKLYDLSDRLGVIPETVGGGHIPYEAPKNIKPIENFISKMNGYKNVAEVGTKGYNGHKNFTKVKYDDVVATGVDATGNTTKWVIPKGYDSVDDFLNKVSDDELRTMGYATKEEFKETVANLERYLNDDNGRLINQD